MNKIRNIIIILIIIILIIILTMFLLELNLNNNKNIVDSEGDVGEIIEVTNQMEEVTDISDFKNIEQCIQKYYNMINNQSSMFYERNEDGEYKKISNTKISQMRLNLLSEDYIKNNNINVSNIYDYINTVEEQGNVVALKMKKLVNNNVDKYLVQAIFINFNNEVLDEFYIVVNLDTVNENFSIEPILDKYNDINEIKIINNNNSIETNENNTYSKKLYDYEDIAEEYFLTYKRLILSKPEIVYNCMDIEYKNKRFENENNFLKYITENKEQIQKLKLTGYLVNNLQEVTQYVCKDQYENVYIFDETMPMQLSLKLDNYTIPTDNFKTEYAKASEEKKVQMNIDKFIQMINRHDYKTSYNCLADSFKSNYFNTQEEFENYIKNNLYEYNKLKFKSFEEKGNNVYVYTIQLTDLTEENSEIKEITIIMKLNDNLDFEMSFSV